MMSALSQLADFGQSFWLDNLSREMLRNGDLQRRVDGGLLGITSNPAIFDKAMRGGSWYEAEVEHLGASGLGPSEIYEQLTVADVGEACDLLLGVWERTNGVDGYVSLEVSPRLANDTEATLAEARRLYSALGRKNALIKIPGTPAGGPAIRRALFEGINVNVTLLFSCEAYETVAEAHTQALEDRLDAGLPVDDTASVASFFLSRIDSLTDKKLAALAAGLDGSEKAGVESLAGEAAVANAKIAYQGFERRLASDRWKRLEEAGARPQRMLWASTSTKNPAYSDVKYVEPLIGPLTVNTLPESTITAFDDHGTAALTVRDGRETARAVMDRLAAVGIDFDQVCRELLDEGVTKFIEPYCSTIAWLEQRLSVPA